MSVKDFRRNKNLKILPLAATFAQLELRLRPTPGTSPLPGQARRILKAEG